MSTRNTWERLIVPALYLITVLCFAGLLGAGSGTADTLFGYQRTYGVNDTAALAQDLKLQGVPDRIANQMIDSAQSGTPVTSGGGVQFGRYSQIKNVIQVLIALGLLLLANWLTIRADVLNRIRIRDHVRQSAAFYILLPLIWFASRGDGEAPIIPLLGFISLIAIVANALYLTVIHLTRIKRTASPPPT